MWQFWLIAAGIFLIAEIATIGFLVFWLSVGALLAMVVSFFTDNVIIQTAVFVVSSGLLIFITKPFVNKFAKNNKTVPTNVYSTIGKEVIVTKEINSIEATGQVKIDGEIWSATCEGTSIIPKGSMVKVIQIDGVKVIVEPIKEPTMQN